METQGFGIILNSVLFSDVLTDKQKLLYCYITSLSAEKGYCYANNQHFVNRGFAATVGTISKNLVALEKAGFIRYEMGKTGEDRKLYPLVSGDQPPGLSKPPPLVSKDQHNNINIINKELSKDNSKDDFEKKVANTKVLNNIVTQIIENVFSEVRKNGDVPEKDSKDRWIGSNFTKNQQVGEVCFNMDVSLPEFARLVVEWSYMDDFWKGKIISMKSVYYKWPTIYNLAKKNGWIKSEEQKINEMREWARRMAHMLIVGGQATKENVREKVIEIAKTEYPTLFHNLLEQTGTAQ